MKKLLLFFLAILPIIGMRAESTVVGNTDNSSTWWTAFSQDYLMVKGDKWHFVIKNYTGKQYMWDNLVLFVTTDGNRGHCTEHLAFRQDRETGGNGNYWGACKNNGTVTVTDNYLEKGYQESDFLNEMDGATIDITVTYDEDGTYTIDEDITLASGNKYQRKAVCTGINNVVRLFFTIERSHIEIQEAQKVQSKYIGSMDKDNAWWRCHSNLYTLNAGKTVHLKFKTHASLDNNAYNWNLLAYNGVGHPLTQGAGYQEYFVVRNDQYALTGGGNVSFRNTIKYYNNGVGESIDQNWETYRKDCQDADVDMYITFSGGKINVNAWTTKGDHVYTYGFTYTANIDAETITYAFTPEHAYMSDFEILADDLTAIGAADCSSEWTDGYNESTSTQKHTLQDGESYRYKFINVNKTDNKFWNNTMVRAFNDNDELKVSLRFDNYEDITGNADRIRMSDRNSLEDIHAAVIDLVATYKGTPGEDGKLYISERILGTNGTTEHYYQFQKTTTGNTICLQTHSNYFILLEEGVPTEEQINNVYELPYKAKAESYYSSHDALDEAGKTAYDAACTKTTYPMLYDDVDNDVRANYITGIKAQTTPGVDKTRAVENANCTNNIGFNGNGWKDARVKSNNWYATDIDDNVIDLNNVFINYWSVEGDNDGTGLGRLFTDLWSFTPEQSMKVKHDQITGLAPGYYNVSILTRVRDFKNGVTEVNGLSFFANDATSTTRWKNGTDCQFARLEAVCEVTEDGTLDFGFVYDKENVNFTWLAFKDVELTFYGDSYVNLKDKETFTYTPGTYCAISLTRTLKAGWNTICLPFTTTVDAVAGSDAMAYGFSAAEENVLSFTEVSDMEANVPYLLYCGTEVVNPTLHNVTLMAAEPVEVENGDWKFISNYTPGMNMEGKYGVTNGQVRLAGSGSTLNGMRAYFNFEGSGDAQAKIKVDGMDSEDDETAISTINSNEAVASYYSLDGKRLAAPVKGINIVKFNDNTIRKIIVK